MVPSYSDHLLLLLAVARVYLLNVRFLRAARTVSDRLVDQRPNTIEGYWELVRGKEARGVGRLVLIFVSWDTAVSRNSLQADAAGTGGQFATQWMDRMIDPISALHIDCLSARISGLDLASQMSWIHFPPDRRVSHSSSNEEVNAASRFRMDSDRGGSVAFIWTTAAPVYVFFLPTADYRIVFLG